ncbi:hypothetical protein RFI_31271, partial [Reticulomyxa filosa]
MASGEHQLAMPFMTSPTRYYENSINNKDITFLVYYQNTSYKVQLVIYMIYETKEMYNCILIGDMKCNGGMQDSNSNNNNQKYVKEIKTLVRLFGDSITEEELKQKIENHHGNIETVIKDLVQQSIEKESKSEEEGKINELKNTEQKQEQGNTVKEVNGSNKSVQKETEKTEIGNTKPGINLQGYCSNETCLASKAKLP